MAKILQPVLQVLNRIYRFDTAQTAPETFDLGAVQPVHDVSRESAYAAGRFAGFAQTQVHAGAGTLYQQVTQAQLIAGLGLEADEEAWLVSVTAETGTTAPNNLGATVTTPAALVPTSPRNFLVYYATVQESVTAGGVLVGNIATGAPLTHNLPLPLRQTIAFMQLRSTSTAAGTVTWAPLFWIGALGDLPPVTLSP